MFFFCRHRRRRRGVKLSDWLEIARCSYVLALEKKNGTGENNICLKYIRSVQWLLLEGDKVT